MSKVREYKAQRDLKMDCGDTVKTGEAFTVISFFTCPKHGEWMQNVWRGAFPSEGEEKR